MIQLNRIKQQKGKIMAEQPQKELMTMKEAAIYLKHHHLTLLRWANEGKFSTARKIGKEWRVEAEEVWNLGRGNEHGSD
jgi:excisionase family DNA binding protein